uniref:Uncharacterized protein n=1 Tax=Nelumbo nucifera TaxID=4432 RepID=A0A822XTS9_NELNU|nr:TPA_asm: hypothetical protein HUJ06_025190 [Nelumbo nucifera]
MVWDSLEGEKKKKREKDGMRNVPGLDGAQSAEHWILLQSQPKGSPLTVHAGKIVFQSLERNSSCPSSFNGGLRIKHRGMERSYFANVRVTPVLNVSICLL